MRALWHRLRGHKDAIYVFLMLCLLASIAGAAEGWVSR